jgi:hypothetical protein
VGKAEIGSRPKIVSFPAKDVAIVSTQRRLASFRKLTRISQRYRA